MRADNLHEAVTELNSVSQKGQGKMLKLLPKRSVSKILVLVIAKSCISLLSFVSVVIVWSLHV